MVLKLDPRIPLVWRDPTTIQLGVATPVAVLTDVGPAAERMIAALGSGISESGLAMIGLAAGADAAEIERVMRAVSPALLPESSFAPTPVVVLVGTGPTAEQLTAALASSEVRVRVAPTAELAVAEDCDLGIIVTRYVVPPALHAAWLRRDVPHIAVVLTESDATIGPVIDPGAGPCLHCLTRYRTDADAAWPAIATQLLARTLPTEPPLLAGEVAATAARLALRRLGGPERVHRSVTIDAATGARSTADWVPHPECGCVGLERLSDSARPGTGSAGVGRRDEPTRPPRTGRAADARA